MLIQVPSFFCAFEIFLRSTRYNAYVLLLIILITIKDACFLSSGIVCGLKYSVCSRPDTCTFKTLTLSFICFLFLELSHSVLPYISYVHIRFNVRAYQIRTRTHIHKVINNIVIGTRKLIHIKLLSAIIIITIVCVHACIYLYLYYYNVRRITS